MKSTTTALNTKSTKALILQEAKPPTLKIHINFKQSSRTV